MSSSDKPEEFNEHEQEVIILSAVCFLLDEMNNRAMFTLHDGSNIFFKTSAHTKLFNIWLVDFLSKIQPSGKERTLPFDLTEPLSVPTAQNNSYLFYLLKICESPQLGENTLELKRTCKSFVEWLEEDIVLEKVWFPSIDLEINLKVKRFDALKHTGNIAKHNFTRLEHTVKKIRKLLINNGCNSSLTLEECYVMLPEFQEWFHDHAFIALSSSISEQLNNIRWAIYNYLRNEFSRAYKREGSDNLHLELYSFDIPKQISHPLAKASYWELMNSVRAKPILPKYKFPSWSHELLS